MSTQVATIIQAENSVIVTDQDGNSKLVEVADVLHLGDIIQTGEDGSATLMLTGGQKVSLGPNQVLTLSSNLLAEQVNAVEDNAIEVDSLEETLAAIDNPEGGDLLEALDATAAGGGAADAGGAMTLEIYSIADAADAQYEAEGGVPQVARVVETTDPLAFESDEFAAQDALISPEGEDLLQVPPVAVDDAFTTPEDTSIVITSEDLLSNDSDADGDSLTIVSVTQPDNGSLIDNGDGTYTYTPNPDYNGNDSFTYQITDGNGGYDTATGNIIVTPVVDTVYAQIVVDSESVPEGEIVNYTVHLVDNEGNPVVVPVGETVTVNLEWSGEASGGADTSTLPNSVVITGGSSTTFPIEALTDSNYEGDEPLVAQIVSVSHNSSLEEVAIGVNDTANTVITDTTVITVADVTSDTQPEGNTLTHTVTMSGESVNDETYSFSIIDNTTEPGDWDNLQFTNGVTYDSVAGEITVPAGVTEFDVTTYAVDDATYELDEFYDISVGGVAATGTILANDPLTFTLSGDASVAEGNAASYSIVMTGGDLASG
ncbi:retention module-containing protein, partial [Thiomicrorhabdus sp. 6S3-12]|uniref:retention module-containing protein n=1 Tax=Thiomicrorhabdus sp. 6S3-12 TaxID=2819681 RepID=UPI001AAD7C04